MNAVIFTLTVALAARGINATQALESIPKGEVGARLSKIMETIANATKQERDHWVELRRELKGIKGELKGLRSEIKTSDLKLKPAPKPDPTLGSSPEATTHQEISRLIVNPGRDGVAPGTAGASSQYTSDYLPSEAFDGTGDWMNRENRFPVAVWMRFPSAHRLQKIGFRASFIPSYMPNEIEVVGSDDCSQWTVLLHLNNRGGFKSDREFKTFVIPAENRASFTCIGLRWPFRDGCDGSVRVGRITMWEQV